MHAIVPYSWDFSADTTDKDNYLLATSKEGRKDSTKAISRKRKFKAQPYRDSVRHPQWAIRHVETQQSNSLFKPPRKDVPP